MVGSLDLRGSVEEGILGSGIWIRFLRVVSYGSLFFFSLLSSLFVLLIFSFVCLGLKKEWDNAVVVMFDVGCFMMV